MERKVNPDFMYAVLRDLLDGTHRLRRHEIGYGENKRLFQQFVNDLFLDSRIVAEIELMQKELAAIDEDGTP